MLVVSSGAIVFIFLTFFFLDLDKRRQRGKRIIDFGLDERGKREEAHEKITYACVLRVVFASSSRSLRVALVNKIGLVFSFFFSALEVNN